MEQIYEIITDLVIAERKISFDNVTGYEHLDRSAIKFESKGCKIGLLDHSERCFVYAMIACSKENVKTQFSYLMKSIYFHNKNTYHSTRKRLLDKHVIVKLPGKHRFVLNPDYHPSMSAERLASISDELSRVTRRRCVEVLNLIDLKDKVPSLPDPMRPVL